MLGREYRGWGEGLGLLTNTRHLDRVWDRSKGRFDKCESRSDEERVANEKEEKRAVDLTIYSPRDCPHLCCRLSFFVFLGGNWLLVCHFQCVEEGLLLADRNINGSYPAAYLGSGSYCGCAGANLLPLSFHFSETIYRFRLLSFISALAERGDT